MRPYAQTGLPADAEWEFAYKLGWHAVRAMGWPDPRVDSFMDNQPLAAARRLLAHCPDVKPATVTAVLLGEMGRALVLKNPQQAKLNFSAETVEFISLLATGAPGTPAQQAEKNRVFLVESMSMMGDQMIGRQKIDRHHAMRWHLLAQAERQYLAVKGENPRLDEVFEDMLAQSKAALSALDRAERRRPPQI